MLSSKGLSSFALAALLFFSDSYAAPHSGKPNVSAKITKRDDPVVSGPTPNNTATTGTNETATLAPVVPPDVNSDALSTLLLGTNVTLAWAGAPNNTAGSKRKLKRDEGVLSQATFTFKYPTVPLDHSNFISNVACSGNTLTGVMTDAAYKYAKSKWTGVTDLVFVTSVDGCGLDNANDFFHATSISFVDSTKSFSAVGASAGPKDVTSYMTLEWGSVPATTKLKRAATKEEMFEPHPLHSRGTHEISLSVPFRAYAHELLGSDMDAPWDNAWKIGEISKGEGEEDDSYKKGEVASADGHHRRSTSSNETSLGLYTRSEIEKAQDEGGFSYGMALYCVDCGFEGEATLYGRLETDWFDIVGLGAGFRMDFKAGIYLGLVAYVKYEKEWPHEIAHVNLAGWEIPLIISVGPFLDVSLVPSFEIKASGALLIGAGIEWNNADIYLDFLHPIDRSYAHNLAPSFQHRIEAAGEVGVEAKLALPVKLGLELKILDLPFTGWAFNAEAAIVEEPAIVAEGKFEVSAEVTDDGTIEYDINGGCYGVAWDIHFENELYFEATADFFGLGGEHTWPLLSFESDPFAEGCIGYVNDGTDDNSDDPQGTGDSTGLGGNGLNSDGNGLAGSSNGNSQDSGSSGAKAVKAQVVSSSSTTSTSTSLSTSSSTSKSSTSTSSSSSSSSTTSKSSTSSPVQALAAATTSSSSSTTSKTTTTSSSSSTTSKSSSTSSTSSSTTSSSKSSTSSSTTSSKPTTTSTTSSSTSSTSKSTSTTPQALAATTTSKSSTTSSTTSSKSSTTSSTSSSSTKTTSTTSPVQAQQTTSKTSTTSSKPTTSSSSTTTSKPTTTSTTSSSTKTTTSTTSSTKTTSTSTSTTPPCTASTTALAKTPTPTATSITCKSTATAAAVPTAAALSTASTVSSSDGCATSCLKNTQCLSFGYVDSTKSCQLYSKTVKNLGIGTKSGNPTVVFWDRECWALNTCPAK